MPHASRGHAGSLGIIKVASEGLKARRAADLAWEKVDEMVKKLDKMPAGADKEAATDAMLDADAEAEVPHTIHFGDFCILLASLSIILCLT